MIVGKTRTSAMRGTTITACGNHDHVANLA